VLWFIGRGKKYMVNKLQFLIIIAIVVFGSLHLYARSQDVTLWELFLTPISRMHIGEMPLLVEIANSPEERTQGLSGRKKLEKIDGMLFVYPETDYHRIWMKDMNFPIDIIWIDEDLTVINIERNVHPDTYPNSFKADRPARYAVETNVHFSDTFGLRPGLKVRLPADYLED